MSTGRSVTQDPIEQVLDKLGSFGVPVTEIGEKTGALFGSLGSFDLFGMMDQAMAIDPSQLNVAEIVDELQNKFAELPPELKVPVMLAAGFVGARVVRWIVR